MLKNSIPKKTHVALNTYYSPEKVIASVLIQYYNDSTKPVYVAVGGPGGSGKTTFAQKLASLLPDAAVLSLDNYKKSRKQRAEMGIWGPHPAANRLDLIVEHLIKLRAGNSVEVPIYDLESGDSPNTYTYRSVRFNIIEGEISTSSQIRDLIDFSIFIDSDFKTQLKTRLGRDMRERGHSYEKAVTNFLKSNIQEFQEYGAESKMWSDVHIYCHDDYNLVLEAVDNKYLKFFQSVAQELKQISIEGLIVPVTTPFDQDETICRKALIDHLEWLSLHGVSRILVSGTTGEFFSLTVDERIELLDIAREYFPGMIMFQAGCDSLTSTTDLVKRAVRHGADVIMVLPPYYFANAPEQGLVHYFRAVADVCQVPLVLYNFPKHTGNPITSNILSQVPHTAVKDSSPECELIPFTPCFLIGSSTRIVQPVQMGAKGFVSAIANCFPTLYVELEACLKSSDFERATEIQKELASKKSQFDGKLEIVQIKKFLASTVDGYPERVRLPLI
jgi:4-hydroxy-tetrahydrodipicolinate synthase